MTKTEAAFRVLRRMIEGGQLAAGQRLRVVALQTTLEMSPTPIREALRLLQAQGLIVNEPHKGMVVRPMPATDVSELYRLREVLEPLAAKLSAERATSEELEEIAAIHGRLHRSVDGNAPWTETAELDFAWHRGVSASCGSHYLQEFISHLWSAIPPGFYWISSRAQQAAAEHASVTDALLARDGARAARLMKQHIHAGAHSHQDRFGAAPASSPKEGSESDVA